MKPVYFGHRGAAHALAKHDSYETMHKDYQSAVRQLHASGAYSKGRNAILQDLTTKQIEKRRMAEDRLAAQDRIRALKMQLQYRKSFR